MQNLKKWPNWYIIVPRKLFTSTYKYNPFETSRVNLKFINLKNRKDVNKLLFQTVSYKVYNKIFKEVCTVKSLVFPSSINHISSLPKAQQIRNFHASRKNYNDKGSSKEGSKDPEKDSKKQNDEEDENIKVMSAKILFFGLITYFLMTMFKNNAEMQMAVISWNEFVHHILPKGEVQRIIVQPEFNAAIIELYPDAIIKGERFRFKRCALTLSNVENFEQQLRMAEQSLGIKREHSIPVIYRHSDGKETIVASVLIAVLLYFLYRARGKIANPGQFFTQITKAKFTLIDPLTGPGKGVRFEDVAGLKEAKIEVMEFVDYLKHPEHYKVLGAKVPKGALLLGPPGCGKTLLAKAVATEANVPFLSMNGSEFIEMYGGLGAARVRDLFKEGRKRAPSILYIDEIDALGKKRSDSGQSGWGTSETEQTLNQLLVEMDGIVSKEGVIVLASTNRAEVLDTALLRPGRFDRHILIDFPTLEERKQIFEQHLKSVVLDHEPSTYSSKLAYLTPGFSGADIANVCNEAALHAARTKKKKVDGSDLAYAIDRTVAGPEKKDHAMSPAEKRVVAYHESGHALVGWLLEHTDALLKVTIVPRTSRALGYAQYIPTDQKLYSREEMFDRMCMMLGGRVAESVTFNKITTGAQNDLTKVTKMAYAQVQQYGMSSRVGLVSFDEEETSTRNRKPYSRAFGNLMDVEARNIIANAHKRTEKLLLENQHKLNLLAETLFKKETLTYEDVVQLIGPPPFAKKRLVDPGDLDAPFKKVSVDTTAPKAEIS